MFHNRWSAGCWPFYILMGQCKKCNSIANALELHLSGTNPLIWSFKCVMVVVIWTILNIDGLVQERRKSIANALELHLSCTNPLIWALKCVMVVVIQEMNYVSWIVEHLCKSVWNMRCKFLFQLRNIHFVWQLHGVSCHLSKAITVTYDSLSCTVLKSGSSEPFKKTSWYYDIIVSELNDNTWKKTCNTVAMVRSLKINL